MGESSRSKAGRNAQLGELGKLRVFGLQVAVSDLMKIIVSISLGDRGILADRGQAEKGVWLMGKWVVHNLWACQDGINCHN